MGYRKSTVGRQSGAEGMLTVIPMMKSESKPKKMKDGCVISRENAIESHAEASLEALMKNEVIEPEVRTTC